LKLGISDTQYPDIVNSFKAFEGTGGAHAARDGNNGEAYGTSWYPNTMNPKTGERSHARNSYYEPIMSRSNLKVLLESVATELVLDGSGKLTAKGVKVTDKKTGSSVTYFAKKEVILAAGAVSQRPCTNFHSVRHILIPYNCLGKHSQASPKQWHRPQVRAPGCWHRCKA
jgi:choline dehydrogenase-like flavoprotein